MTVRARIVDATKGGAPRIQCRSSLEDGDQCVCDSSFASYLRGARLAERRLERHVLKRGVNAGKHALFTIASHTACSNDESLGSMSIVVCHSNLQSIAASPTPVELEAVTKVAERQAASNTVNPIINASQLSAAFASLPADGQSLAAAITAVSAIFTNIVPAPGPTAASQLASEFEKITAANPQDIFESGAQILLNGFAGGDYADIAKGYLLESNTNNLNLRQPATKIYPKASPDDAPYSLSESDLRKALYIPLGFTYGKIQPVIFLPGTGALAGQNFAPNYGKLLAAQHLGDPVYLNLPGANLADVQVAAEYAAYAVNYISGISGGKNVSTISWSAGSLDGHWATKYWPSTRSKISDRICLSPDYHGTVEAQLLCPGFATPGCTPAIAQQNYNSTFIRTLRNNGGDSAFVPTTNIYSIFDEIVEPQQDPNASGALNDARGVGVTNNEIQSTCFAALPGGAPYFEHALVLANALGYALAVDALTHPGPGQLSRINTTLQCDQFLTPGLSLADALATFALIPIAAVNVIAFQPKVATEPPIKAYAQKDIPQLEARREDITFSMATAPYLIALAAGVLSHIAYFNRYECHMHGVAYIQAFLLTGGAAILTLTKAYGFDLGAAVAETAGVLSTFVAGAFTSTLLYRLFLNPLNRFPGPWTARISSLFFSFQLRRSDAYYKLQALHKKYGRIVRIGSNDLSINDADAVELSYGNGSKVTKSQWYDGDIPLTSMHTSRSKSLHDKRRRVWAPAFSDKSLRDYETRIEPFTDKMVQRVGEHKGGPVNVTKWFNLFSFDVMGHLAFNKDYGLLETGEKPKVLDLMTEGMQPLAILPPTWLFRILVRLPGIGAGFQKFVEFCVEELKWRVNNPTDEKSGQKDIMTSLLKAYQGIDHPEQDPMLQADARLIIVAGSDTTSAALTYLFYHLAADPSQQKKLRAELEPLTVESWSDKDLAKASLLNGAINEALRLHPPVPSGVFRLTPKEGLQVGDRWIPGNTNFIIPLYVMQRGPYLHSPLNPSSLHAANTTFLDPPPRRRILQRRRVVHPRALVQQTRHDPASCGVRALQHGTLRLHRQEPCADRDPHAHDQVAAQVRRGAGAERGRPQAVVRHFGSFHAESGGLGAGVSRAVNGLWRKMIC
nr:tryprostatin b 6-hydroxylase [Quercus suber]